MPVEQDSLQGDLRQVFGKEPATPSPIGTHPDFTDLVGSTEGRYCPIVTLFMDIESSTRLGLWYNHDQVAQIKNAFLCTAIEMAHAFDGHVHRIMGDAVMVFFGGEDDKPEDAAINAINCASSLWYFVKSTVIPILKKEGYDEEFGIRVGVDYEPEAFWSAFGFPGVEEVSATGFGVDASSKLQHAAPRNQIMLGQGLLDLLDLPDEVTRIKEKIRNGEKEDRPYLLPNHSLPNGNAHNYRQAILRVEDYLRYSPLADVVGELTGDARVNPLAVKVTVHDGRDGAYLHDYKAASMVLPKDLALQFTVSLPYQPLLPLTLQFKVENHGQEAFERNGEDLGNHETPKTIRRYKPHQEITHWEDLSYRGLHYMIITARDAQNTVVGRRRIGVFIE